MARRDERPAGNRAVGASSRRVGWGFVASCALLIAVATVLLCLQPKSGHDLFWELRTGNDILASGSVPRVDSYSWTCRGTRWDVPEWLSFVLLALAYRVAGGFAGTWLLLVALSIVTALAVFLALIRQGLRPVTAFVLTNLMLLAMGSFLQQRPYLFTCMFVAVGVAILQSARDGRPRLLWWLVPLSVAWTNLHQGVVVMAAILIAAGIGDVGEAMLLRMRARPPAAGPSRVPADPNAANLARRGGLQVAVALLCLAASMISPAGWGVFRLVAVTLRDPNAMSLVREWSPVTMMPMGKVWAYYALVAVVGLGWLFSRRRRAWGDALALAGVLGQSFLHVRHAPLFAIASVLISARHVESAIDRVFPQIPALSFTRASRRARLAATGLVLVYLAVLASVGIHRLSLSIGPKGYTLEGIGEASVRLSGFPEEACAFMEAEGFPPNLRLYNDYDIGGYLIWRLPSQPVFIDQRYFECTGPVLADLVALRNARGPDDCREVLDRRDFDCVITMVGSEIRAFALDAENWVPVYAEARGPLPPGRGRCWILLRNRPEFHDLIARCRRDCPALNRPLR